MFSPLRRIATNSFVLAGRRGLKYDATSFPFTALDFVRLRLRASCLCIHSSCAPDAPFSFRISPSTYALLSSIDMSCAPRSPGLLVRLHFVSMSSVLPFRSLQVPDLYITWFAVCLEMETFPSRSSTPTLCAIKPLSTSPTPRR